MNGGSEGCGGDGLVEVSSKGHNSSCFDDLIIASCLQVMEKFGERRHGCEVMNWWVDGMRKQ